MSTAPTGFRIAFPPGWSRFLVDDEGRRALVKRTSARMKQLGRPDLDAEARTLVEVQWRRLKASRVTAVYLPGESEQVSLPASLAVRQHVSQGGRDFHASVRAMGDGAGVTLDTPVGQVTRWQREEAGTGELSDVRSRRIGYGIALPGDASRRGLIFLAAIPYPVGADPQLVAAMTELMDTVMETFRWN